MGDPAVGAGHLIRVHHAVYAAGHTRLTRRGRWMAAVLACGPEAGLSHRSGVSLHDLPGAPARPIEVTAPEIERRFLALVRAGGLPEPQVNVLLDGTCVDPYWPEAGLIVETDSFTFHRTRETFESDRGQDIVSAVAGRSTIRPTWRRIANDPAGLQRDLRTLLAARRGRADR